MQKTRKHSDPPPPFFSQGGSGFHRNRHNLRWALLKLRWRRFLVRFGGFLWQIRLCLLWLWHRVYSVVCPQQHVSTQDQASPLSKRVAIYLETHPRVDSMLKMVMKYSAQFIFLFTGVFSTCAAQFVFYQGAGDQKAMLLPLCNYLGMMLVGLMPSDSATSTSQKATTNVVVKRARKKSFKKLKFNGHQSHSQAHAHRHATSQTQIQVDPSTCAAPEEAPEQIIEKDSLTPLWDVVDSSHQSTELTRRGPSDVEDDDKVQLQQVPVVEADETPEEIFAEKPPENLNFQVTPSRVSFTTSTVQLLILVSVVLDFAGCIFSNVGLAMAGSGLYQVVYSSVICWSALMSRFILKKQVSLNEWIGIALVTFGLAFSALGQSGSQRNNYVVLMGCLNTLIGAAFYGGNYVAGEYALMLPERPQPQELCLKIGTACVLIISVYQIIFVLPDWHQIITYQIDEAQGNVKHVVWALFAYTLSQLAHGLTYFVMLGSSGAVTTGIMQSLRAVCVFIISSVLYCKHQESQCFDSKRGVATLVVVAGVLFYSWAKSNAKNKAKLTTKKRNSFAEPERRRRTKSKSYIV